MNKKYINYLLDRQGLTMGDLADILGIKKDSLYRKVAGINGFRLLDIITILNVVKKPFEEVFIDEEHTNENEPPLPEEDNTIIHPLTHDKVFKLSNN